MLCNKHCFKLAGIITFLHSKTHIYFYTYIYLDNFVQPVTAGCTPEYGSPSTVMMFTRYLLVGVYLHYTPSETIYAYNSLSDNNTL